MENISVQWQQGIASVQLTLDGKYRAVNRNGIPKKFDSIKEAEAWAKSKTAEKKKE